TAEFEFEYPAELTPAINNNAQLDSFVTSEPIEFYNENQELVYVIRAPYSLDANGDKFDCRFAFDKSASKLQLQCPYSELLTAQYPVYIDPSAVCVYSNNSFSIGEPFSSYYNGTGWSTPATMNLLYSGVNWVRVASDPNAYNRAVAVTLDTNFDIRGYIWNGISWAEPLGSPMSSPFGASISTKCCFDVVFNSTGTAICVFSKNTLLPTGFPYVTTLASPYSSWTSATALPVSNYLGMNYPQNVDWIEMAADHSQQLVYAVTLGRNITRNDTYGYDMSSLGWCSYPTLLSNDTYTTSNGSIDVECEFNSGDAVCVWSENATSGSPSGVPYYSTFSGVSWSAKSPVPLTSGSPNNITWVRMAPRTTSGSNELALATLDLNTCVYANTWGGLAWSGFSQLTNIAYITSTGCLDVAYEHTSGNAVCVWAEGGISFGLPFYSIKTVGWSAKLLIPSSRAFVKWVRMDANLTMGSDEIYVAALDGSRDLAGYVRNGISWSNPLGSPMTTVAFTSDYGCFDVAATRIPELPISMAIPIAGMFIIALLVRKRRKSTIVGKYKEVST
ncbi:MAG: hypothetical protein KAJ51_06615, partial [Thermoplasmata archaeon]|nr:hypothetical protein [Thermoplasmata archaeon]